MPVLHHFDWLAPIYEWVIPFREPQKMITYAGLPVSGPLLDAAGGTGRVSQVLRRYATEVVVADLSEGMLRQAVETHDLPSVRAKTEALPFPDGYFQRVIMVDALHHVIDHKATADELWRVLKPGGRILIEEPDIRHLGVKFVALAEKLALMRSHFLSPSRIEGFFEHPNARTKIEIDGFNAYVLIDKQ